MYLATVKANTVLEAWKMCALEVLEHGESYAVHNRSDSEGTIRKSIAISLEINGSGVMSVGQGFPAELLQNVFAHAATEYCRSLCYIIDDILPYSHHLDAPVSEMIRLYHNNKQSSRYSIVLGKSLSIDNLNDSPCLRMVEFHFERDTLHMFLHYRSWDLWTEFILNLVGFQMLKKKICSILCLEEGNLFAFSKSLHLYGQFVDDARGVCEKV